MMGRSAGNSIIEYAQPMPIVGFRLSDVGHRLALSDLAIFPFV
jgi:hypothetical protein